MPSPAYVCTSVLSCGALCLHARKAGMTYQISSKQHTCLHAMIFQMLYDFLTRHAFFADHQKSEPGWYRMFRGFWQYQQFSCGPQRLL